MHLGVLGQVHNGFRDYKKKKNTHTQKSFRRMVGVEMVAR